MSEKITVVIADDSAEARKSIRRLLQFDPDFAVVGEAENGLKAVELAAKLQPDCILMDINMPEMDGIRATERIALQFPNTSIIMMSVQSEQEYLRQAMLVGAREYLAKPFSADELITSLKRVHSTSLKRRKAHGQSVWQREVRFVTVFSAKGGVGKTTIATNLAVALASEWKKDVVLVDLDLQFGDVGVTLDLDASTTITDLVQADSVSRGMIDDYLVTHQSSGLKVLHAPVRPEEAELVTVQHLEKIFDVLKQMADYVIIDTAQAFHDNILFALDRSDAVLVISTLDVPTIKNVKLSLDVMNSLNYPKDKVSLVINRASEDMGIDANLLKKKLDFPIVAHVPSDGRLVINSVNQGIPFFLMNPRAKISESIRSLAEKVTGEERIRFDDKKGVLMRLFG